VIRNNAGIELLLCSLLNSWATLAKQLVPYVTYLAMSVNDTCYHYYCLVHGFRLACLLDALLFLISNSMLFSAAIVTN